MGSGDSFLFLENDGWSASVLPGKLALAEMFTIGGGATPRPPSYPIMRFVRWFGNWDQERI